MAAMRDLSFSVPSENDNEGQYKTTYKKFSREVYHKPTAKIRNIECYGEN